MTFVRALLIVAILLIVSISYGQNIIDVQHYKFQITLRDENDTISGKATILVKFLESSNQLIFDLSSVKKNKGMSVSNVFEDTLTRRILLYEHKDDKLTIKLPESHKAGELLPVTIVYQGIPADALVISKNKYRHRTFFADNWPNRGHNWIPCVDEPADKASVEFLVTAPQHYQVVGNGILVEESNLENNLKLTHWKEDVPLATKVMVIGAADFAVSLAGTVDGCIPVYSWVYPEDRDKGFYDYAQAIEILPFYIKYVGPYGYKKLANVQSKTIFGGLENANTIFYAENSINGKRKKEDLLAHEIAHQWFGNMATEKTFAHLWLSEGFATYMTIIYMENKYGRDTLKSMLKEDRNQVITFVKESNNPVVDEKSSYMELLNANSYQKGGWILHMLRQQLGDDVFQKSIRNYYAAYAGKNADTRDLQKIFEKTSGKNLTVFFDQWLYKPGIPQLDIKWKYNSQAKKLELKVEQIQQNVFEFPLEIKINTSSSKSILKTVQVNQAVQNFSIPVDASSVKIEVDPNVSLLFKSTLTETK